MSRRDGLESRRAHRRSQARTGAADYLERAAAAADAGEPVWHVRHDPQPPPTPGEPKPEPYLDRRARRTLQRFIGQRTDVVRVGRIQPRRHQPPEGYDGAREPVKVGRRLRSPAKVRRSQRKADLEAERQARTSTTTP